MRISVETVFAIGDFLCRPCVVCDETGKCLDSVVWLETDTGIYAQYVQHEDGRCMYDENGNPIIEMKQCQQMFFTIAAPCRCENSDAQECSPNCGGAAKEQ